MRRKHIVFVALVSVITLVGLTAPVSAGAVRVGVAYDSPLGDMSFNDLTHAGVVAAEADFPIVVKEMDPFNVRGTFIGFEGVIERLAERADLVVSVGLLYSDAVAAMAEQRPDLDFVALDNLIELPNVASVIFAAHEGAFLVGAAAAMTSETDTVGFIGGVDIFAVQNFEAGYLAGIHHVNRALDPPGVVREMSPQQSSARS